MLSGRVAYFFVSLSSISRPRLCKSGVAAGGRTFDMGMTIPKALEEAGITDADVQLRVIHLIGVWLEGLLYGVYLHLFLAASPMLVRRNTLKNFSAAVFVMGNLLMFVLISIHSALSATNICLPILAFAYQTDSQGTSRMLNDQPHWAYFISLVLGVMVFLTGDVLVIYRCFLLWQRRYLVIIVPCLLDALAICITVATMVFVHTVPVSFIHPRNWPIISLPFFCYLLQNGLTTSLIAYKIYSHLRQTRAVGLVSVHTPKLLPIVKILVESAVVYTAGVLVMAVLLALDHPAWFAMHSCMMPIIGIVFVLMALRIHAVREESKDMPASPSLLPSWLVEDKPHLRDSDPQFLARDLASRSSQFFPLLLPVLFSIRYDLHTFLVGFEIYSQPRWIRTDNGLISVWYFHQEIGGDSEYWATSNLSKPEYVDKDKLGALYISLETSKRTYLAPSMIEEAGLAKEDIEVKIAYLISVWLQGFLYGVYICLFIAVLPITIRGGALKNFTAAVFFMGNMLIFFLVSIICVIFFASLVQDTPGVSVFDTVVAFAYQIESKGPIRPFNDRGYWVGYIPLMLAVFIAMIGDILMVVIYRCFLVWQRSYRVIFVSLILAALSFGCHIATVWFANHVPFNLFRVQNWLPMASTPVFYLLQTTLTTSLIAWKIWSQTQRNTNVELAPLHVPRLLSIMRIIVESAVIYTIGMLVMLVLLILDHPARIAIHSCMIPITGKRLVLGTGGVASLLNASFDEYSIYNSHFFRRGGGGALSRFKLADRGSFVPGSTIITEPKINVTEGSLTVSRFHPRHRVSEWKDNDQWRICLSQSTPDLVEELAETGLTAISSASSGSGWKYVLFTLA
ncbi:hypothetical protein BKA70DRAFT_1240470 [Coprinopsis sp. MPI-PUGE-AT-0042]|nr:hypothetical protein BKA70DRAFT_1240470 [Coprinopsis sp. MPI-PUGE-AT-0042]